MRANGSTGRIRQKAIKREVSRRGSMRITFFKSGDKSSIFNILKVRFDGDHMRIKVFSVFRDKGQRPVPEGTDDQIFRNTGFRL